MSDNLTDNNQENDLVGSQMMIYEVIALSVQNTAIPLGQASSKFPVALTRMRAALPK